MKCPSQSLYLANKYFEHRMNKHRVTLELVHLFSTGSAVYLLLQGIIYSKKEEKKTSLSQSTSFTLKSYPGSLSTVNMTNLSFSSV